MRDAADAGKYGIRLASRLTSIAPDTLRVWERRYGFPKPARTAGGGRLYSDADVAMLRLVAQGIAGGYRPNELLGKSRRELEALLRALGEVGDPPPAERPAPARPPTVATIIEAVLREDAEALRSELRRAATALGPRDFVVELAHPLAVRVGELWASGTLAVRHEHLVSEHLSTQLRVLLAAYEDAGNAPVVVLATPPGELHALGLLMVALYASISGATPRLLGASTPIDDICEAARAFEADAVGVSVSGAYDARKAERQLKDIRRALPSRVRVWIGGGAELRLPERVEHLATWPDVERALAAAR